MRYGHDSLSGGMAANVDLMVSALVTFLPEGEADDSTRDTYERLGLQDRDFVDLWWGVLDRQMRETTTTSSAASSSGAAMATNEIAPPTQLTEEEMDLIRQYEAEDRAARMRMEKEDMEKLAQEEFQHLVDSQEAESLQRDEERQRLQDAANFRDWEAWEVTNAMTPDSVPAGRLRLRLRGQVGRGPPQTMQWDLQAGETICLEVGFDASAVNTSDGSAKRSRNDTNDDLRDKKTSRTSTKGSEGSRMASEAKGWHEESAVDDRGDEQQNDSQEKQHTRHDDDLEGMAVKNKDEGKSERSESEMNRPSKPEGLSMWSRALPNTASVVMQIDDSQN